MPFNQQMAGILEADCYSFMKAAAAAETPNNALRQPFTRVANFLRNFATFGATTYWQYGWPPLFTKYSW